MFEIEIIFVGIFPPPQMPYGKFAIFTELLIYIMLLYEDFECLMVFWI